MTRQQAGVSAEQVRAIFANLTPYPGTTNWQAFADRLNALATAPPEQAALEELQAKYDSLKFQWDSLQDHEHARFVAETECGCDSSKGVLCDAHNPIMQCAERSLMQPQPASAVALREAICNILVFGKPDAQITAELELLFEQLLAAHDQKVRAEVLEEAAWLIERNGMCLGFCDRKFTWLTFTNESALRFCRRSDAIRFIEAMRDNINLDDVLVTEHLWSKSLASGAEKKK